MCAPESIRFDAKVASNSLFVSNSSLELRDDRVELDRHLTGSPAGTTIIATRSCLKSSEVGSFGSG